MKFEKEVMQNLAMVTQLGISMLAPIILCVFAGHWLDERFGFHSVIGAASLLVSQQVYATVI